MVIPPGQESIPVTSEERPWAQSLNSDERIASNVADLIKSRAVAKRIISKTGLDISPAQLQLSIDAEPFKAPKLGQELLTNLISVSVNAPSSRAAQNIANTLGKEFISFYSDLNEDEAQKERKVIEEEVIRSRRVFQRAKKRLETFRSRYHLTDMERQSSLLTERLFALNDQLQAAETSYSKVSNSQKKALGKMLNKLKKEIAEFSVKEAGLNEIEASTKITEDTYLKLTEKLAAARIKEGTKSWSGYIRLVDTANAPNLPNSHYQFSNDLLSWIPPFDYRKIGIIFGTVLASFLLSIGVIWLLDRLDNTIKSAEDLEIVTGVNAVGIIPYTEPNERILYNMSGPYAESYNILQVNLSHQLVANTFKTILVTGAKPKDGASTLVYNLSMSMAEAGLKVLLIDANIRQPRIHSFLSLENVNGLVDILRGSIDLKKAIQNTGIDNLFVVTSGSQASNPISLLSSENMQKILDDLKKDFDVVLLDSPSSVAYADSCALARYSDQILFAVKAGAIMDRSVYHYALSHLSRASSSPISAVLIGAQPENCESYFHYYFRSKISKNTNKKIISKEEILTNGNKIT